MAGTTAQGEKPSKLNNIFSHIEIKIDLVADASDNTFPDTTVSDLGGWLSLVYVTFGTTAPTTASDLTIEYGGIDILGGAGADIVTTADAIIQPKTTLGDAFLAPFAGDLTVKVSGNSVASAEMTIYLFFVS